MNPSIVARAVKLKGDLTVDTLLGGRAGGEPTIHFVIRNVSCSPADVGMLVGIAILGQDAVGETISR